ncbi:MAG: phosphate acetyltransferase [Christensenellales bacterium]|nr:phosphate acetyltransferase [Clostridiales bacterium]
MAKLIDSIIERAKTYYKHIVLPEGEETRIIRAAEIINSHKIAKVTLLGDKNIILKKSEDNLLDGVEIISPETSHKLKKYANLLYDLRKDKGLTLDAAYDLAKTPMYFACLMLKNNDADGVVAGSTHSTSDVLRPAFQIIKTKPGIINISSCFVMVFPEGTIYGDNGTFVFADCAVIPNPDSNQLVDIAVASVESARVIADIKEPKVAMLSFSTKGSAKHDNAKKVQLATRILEESNVDFDFDGELQLDAAIVPEVAALKAPNSKVAGKANVLIFPDLQAGNIGYKIAERFGNAKAFGPICQGLALPINDLSRGCDVTDIISVVAITALQAENSK